MAYRNKRGSLNPGMRMEHGAAMVACSLSNIHRSKDAPARKIYDFMPHMEEPPITMEQAMKAWK